MRGLPLRFVGLLNGFRGAAHRGGLPAGGRVVRLARVWLMVRGAGGGLLGFTGLPAEQLPRVRQLPAGFLLRRGGLRRLPFAGGAGGLLLALRRIVQRLGNVGGARAVCGAAVAVSCWSFSAS